MRWGVTLLMLAAGVALVAGIWAASGAFVFILPVVFGLPLLWPGRRR